ncbi:L-dopachrome tautomerase-related protein [Halovulum sp. GXIMD14794]
MLGYYIRNYLLRPLAWLAGVLVVLGLAAAIALYFFFGGGADYRDWTTEPVLPSAALEPVLDSDRPVGDIAAAGDGRIFYTLHPAASPEPPLLMLAEGGETAAFPPEGAPADLFDTPQGLDLDAQGRLWVVDSGDQGLGAPTLIALDATSGEVLLRRDLSDVAPVGSYLQDVRVDPEGAWVYIADTGYWAQRPALVVYDVAQDRARRLLDRHETVMPQDWLIRNPVRPMQFLGGLVSLKAGIDGLALSDDGAWLYYAAMNHSTLYRVPTALLQQPNLPHVRLAVDIETVALKPLSAGLEMGAGLHTFIGDVEHNAVHRFRAVPPEEGGVGTLETLVRDDRLRWPGSLDLGPDGWLYIADSGLPDVLRRSRAHIEAAAPYTIWRVQPDPASAGAPSQTSGG